MIDFLKSSPWTAAIGGAILLAAIVGIVIALVRRGGTADAGWMVRDGNKLHWELSDIPFGLLFHDDISPALRQIIFDTICELELIIGRSVFLTSTRIAGFNWERMPPTGFVSVVFSDDENGHTEHNYDKRTGRILSARVSIPDNLTAPDTAKVVAHELGGHVLGLDHDELTDSIMHPRLQHRAQSFTAADKRRLKDAYGPK